MPWLDRPPPPPTVRPFHPKRRGGGVRVVVLAHDMMSGRYRRTVSGNRSHRPFVTPPVGQTPLPFRSNANPLRNTSPQSRTLGHHSFPAHPHVSRRQTPTRVDCSFDPSAVGSPRTADQPHDQSPLLEGPPIPEAPPLRCDDEWSRNGRVQPSLWQRGEPMVSDRRTHRSDSVHLRVVPSSPMVETGKRRVGPSCPRGGVRQLDATVSR